MWSCGNQPTRAVARNDRSIIAVKKRRRVIIIVRRISCYLKPRPGLSGSYRGAALLRVCGRGEYESLRPWNSVSFAMVRSANRALEGRYWVPDGTDRLCIHSSALKTLSRLVFAGFPVLHLMGTIEFLKTRGSALLSSKEACQMLGCHSEMLYVWVRRGYLEHVRAGDRIKFTADQLLKYLEKRTA
jgi:excisionase family DNA binding protein